MDIQENASLAAHSTMRLGGKARYLAEAVNEDELANLVSWAREKQLSCMMIGQGSNIVWRDEGYDGLIIVNRIQGREIISEDSDGATVRLAGGEIWDDAVAWTVEKGWSGVEYLSLIPGTVGAGPIQNLGAYGAELSHTLVEVGAFDTTTLSFGGILNAACEFSYRNSRFKGKDKGRFMITSVVLRLSKSPPAPPFYEALEKYFGQRQITSFTPKIVRDAVMAIRSAKLPDPAFVANNGSFFTNPIVEEAQFISLRSAHPDIKGWPQPDGRVKLAAGWLVEAAGFKDVHDQETGMATWPKQALVLVNEHAGSTANLLKFKQKITDRVKDMFGVVLEQEPELLP
jgi:UDP-N-acetylmuramate dehydrogenase